jgi:hypothetical protein
MPDTGLVNYFSGIQSTLAPATDLAGIFQGQVLRHVVGQELSGNRQDKEDISFWVRDKAQSEAEVDYVIPFDGLLIPIAVKSGEPGRLRSLHQFIDMAPHPYAVRLYAGNVTIRRSQTIKGKSYYLLSLPYFLSCRISEHLRGFVRYVSG